MTDEYDRQPIDRRKFLKTAAVTAVAATATGIGAAVMQKSNQTTPTITTSPITQPLLNPDNQTADTLTQLAAAQAQNVRLQADLESAQRRWEALQRASGESGSALQAISIELDSANERIGLLAGLVALYEQLDDADLTALFEEGMDAVSAAIVDMVEDIPGLSEGIALGQEALAELDSHIPTLEDGRNWLTDQASKLQQYFQTIEDLLATAVDQAAPFLQMFHEWVQKILKWLPFGLGERTSAIMDALTNLLTETPLTANGIHTQIADPLNVWLGSGDEKPLRQKIIKPLQDQVLTSAEQMAGKTLQVQTTFQEKVERPMETAVTTQRHLKNLIDTYRHQHQV